MCNTEVVTITAPHPHPVASVTESGDGTSPRAPGVEGDGANNEETGQALSSVDGGPAAWRLLCAAFVFEALLWGT
jgi:hypothetical protein